MFVSIGIPVLIAMIAMTVTAVGVNLTGTLDDAPEPIEQVEQ
jgi:hypothetical protein